MTYPYPLEENIVEVVGDWTLTVRYYDTDRVEIESKDGQEASIDRDGVLEVAVHFCEKGHGWDGDCAQARSIPGNVVLRAFALWQRFNTLPS